MKPNITDCLHLGRVGLLPTFFYSGITQGNLPTESIWRELNAKVTHTRYLDIKSDYQLILQWMAGQLINILKTLDASSGI